MVGPATRRQRATAVQQRHRLDVAVARRDRYEQRVPREVEDHRERAGQEADDVELRHRQEPGHVAHRDAEDQRRTPEVGLHHQPPPGTHAIQPHAGG